MVLHYQKRYHTERLQLLRTTMENVVPLSGPNASYLAALWDVKGCWNWRQSGAWHTPRLTFSTKKKALALWLADVSVGPQMESVRIGLMGKDCYVVAVTGVKLQWLLQTILPYLKFKIADANDMLEWFEEPSRPAQESYYERYIRAA